MFDFKEKSYVVLEFVTVDGDFTDIETKKDKQKVHLSFPAIIEIAAVKINGGKIVEHYSTFVGLDGCNANDLKFEEDSPEIDGISAEHLIGAPSFYEAGVRLFEFTRGCTLITKYSKNDSRNPIHIVKRYMEPAGYVFNNPVLSLNNIITAIQIKDNLSECKEEQEGLDCYKLALELENKESYDDMVAGYLDIDPDSARQDSLSRALIMARLFIELTKDKNRIQPIDEDIPF